MATFWGIFVIFLPYFLTYTIAHRSPSKYHYNTTFITVPLDHFSYTTNKTFELRYLINASYVADKYSPILFYTGNEGDIELFAANSGFIWEIAPTLGAMIVFAEHRYYGKSLPFGNKSFDTPEHYGYLTSEQALADYSVLLTKLNPQPPARSQDRNRPVIALGGSYGGMLSAWFRMKYPHIVTGAIAASAPILQFGDLTPCGVFSQIVSSVFRTAYKFECANNIKQSWDVLKKLAETPEGRSFLNTKFNFCPNSNMSKPEDINTFTDYLTDVYGNLAMVNYPYSTDFLAHLPAYPVRQFCFPISEKITNDTILIEALQIALSVYSNYTGKTKCLDIASAYSSDMGDSQWNFQTCTEMVMPMCSNLDKERFDMFPKVEWNFKNFSDDCFRRYGVRPNENAAIRNYGGNNLEAVSNIVFSNGLLDPWSGGGVLRSPNEKVKIVLIPEGAHHLDLRAANEDDPLSVISARKTELDTIKMWIRDYYM